MNKRYIIVGKIYDTDTCECMFSTSAEKFSYTLTSYDLNYLSQLNVSLPDMITGNNYTEISNKLDMFNASMETWLRKLLNKPFAHIEYWRVIY